MRIAYLSTSEIPSRAANSVHVMKMCAAFASHGHEVVLYARRGKSAWASPYEAYGVQENFEIVFCDRPNIRGIGALAYAASVSKALRHGGGFDLLYGRHLHSMRASASLGIQMVYEAHIAPMSWVSRKLESMLFREKAFRRLVTISKILAEDYLRLFPAFPPHRIRVAHDGADSISLRPASGMAVVRKPRISYIGQLYAGKGMEVISQLPAQLPDYDFHVVGGNTEDINKWKARIDAPNLVFHGYIPHGSVGKFTEESDVVLAPYQSRVSVYGKNKDISRWMSPLKLFEYMAYGRAIICSDLPVLREVLHHQKNALLVPPDDIGAWCEAIKLLASDAELRSRLGVQARSDFDHNYTWKARASRVIEGL